VRRKTFLGEQQSERTRHPSSSTAPSSNYFISLNPLFVTDPSNLIVCPLYPSLWLLATPLVALHILPLPTAYVLTRFCIPSEAILTRQLYLCDGRHRTFTLLWNPIAAPTQRTPPSSRRDISFHIIIIIDIAIGLYPTPTWQCYYPQLTHLQPDVTCYLATQQIPICSKRYPDFDTMALPRQKTRCDPISRGSTRAAPCNPFHVVPRSWLGPSAPIKNCHIPSKCLR